MTICAPWATVEEIQSEPACGKCADPADVDPAVLADALEAASEILYDLTFGDFPGICDESVRYCSQPGPSNPNPVLGVFGDVSVVPSVGLVDQNAFARGWGCGCGGGRPSCGCSGHGEIDIGRRMVRDMIEVTVDGVVIDPLNYRVEDYRYLVMTDGGAWACCSDLVLSYTYGSEPRTALKRAAMQLACQLALSWCNQPCDLPANMTSLTRQGVTVAVLGQVDANADGMLFGIRSIDAAIIAYRFSRQNRGAAISSPERGPTRRKITWTAA